MVLNKQWYEVIGHQITANPETRDGRSINISKKDFPRTDLGYIDSPLSPITTFLLNSWIVSIKNNRNFIVNFPEHILRPIPLIAYIYSKIQSKSTLIFSSGNINLKNDLITKHNRSYYLLSWSGSDFLYNDIPIGKINKNNLDIKMYWPTATRDYRTSHINQFKKELIKSDKPKILLNGAENTTNVYNMLNSILVEGEEVNESFNKLDIGCIIFENADKYISSENKAKSFIKWLRNNVGDDVHLLFHFSSSDLKFLPFLKEATNSLVIPFNHSLLKNNLALNEPALDYFEDKNSYELKVLEKYNLDNRDTYEFEYNIDIVKPLLNNGNLDNYLRYSAYILRLIDSETIKNKSFFYRTINLFYSLNNLTINPSSLKFVTLISPGNYRYITTPQFIGLFASKLDRENPKNRRLLYKLISTLNNFYMELAQCRRYGTNSFPKIGKDYQLIEIIKNKSEYFKSDKKLIVGTYFRNEVNTLKEFLLRENIISESSDEENEVEIIYLGKLINKFEGFKDCNLLLPGIVPPNFTAVLKMQFNQILILAYEGDNKTILEHQISSVLKPSIESEAIAMEYFFEIYDLIEESTNNTFFKDFQQRYEEYTNSLEEKIPEDLDDEEIDVYEDELSEVPNLTIKEIFGINDTYEEYIKRRKILEAKLNSVENQPHTSSSSGDYIYETMDVPLLNLNTEEVQIKHLNKNRKYLRFKDYDKLNEAVEVKPELFNKNDFVIVLEGNSSFLDLYMDLFNEGSYIDRNYVDYWKELVRSFMKENNLSIKEFYKIYETCSLENKRRPIGYQTFRNWVNGYTLAPSNVQDLATLGELMDDEELRENYKDMYIEADALRNLNRSMGRKLSRLVKNIILNSESVDFNSLSFEESIIYDRIKDSIYQVV